MRHSRLRASSQSRNVSVIAAEGSGADPSSRQRLKEKQKLSEDIKQKYIQELEERNRKLKYEIMKINEILVEQKQKSMVKKEHKLISTESSAQVLRKELDNVYKQIKNYEREIANLQQRQAGGLITDKMSRIEAVIKEKTTHLDKLKAELSSLAKTSVENGRKLKDNAGKQELENNMLKYNEEIKILREKLRQAEEKEKKKMENAKKQYDYVKRLERELIENGVSMDELDQIKKNNIFTQIYDKINNRDEEDEEMIAKPTKGFNLQASKVQKDENPIEDMTLDRYNELKNQTRLYKKLHVDYEKRLDGLEKERLTAEGIMLASRGRLTSKEQEIARMQQQIAELKFRMRGVNLKSGLMSPTIQEVSAKKVLPAQKAKPAPQVMLKSVPENIQFRYDERGTVSSTGQRFTDRPFLGKSQITGINFVRVWTDKDYYTICGMQCGYITMNDDSKMGPEHILKDVKRYCNENSLQLAPGDYIKSVSGHLSTNNVIEYLVFISNDSQIGRFGAAKPNQRQFNFDIGDDEIPSCLYGSLIPVKDGKKELCMLEQIGFEIGKDKMADDI